MKNEVNKTSRPFIKLTLVLLLFFVPSQLEAQGQIQQLPNSGTLKSRPLSKSQSIMLGLWGKWQCQTLPNVFFKFNLDGTYEYTNGKGRYKVVGNTIQTKEDEGTSEIPFSVKGNTLTLVADGTELVLTRVTSQPTAGQSKTNRSGLQLPQFNQQPTSGAYSGSPLVGTWLHYVLYENIYEIVFYPDGSFFSNVISPGKYTILPGAIKMASADGQFSIPYTVQGEYLQLQFPVGMIQFIKVPSTALGMLRGKYCGQGKFNIDSGNLTAVEFDGRGGFISEGNPGLYWVDNEGVHLICQTEDGYVGQQLFSTVQFGNDGLIGLFSGQEGDFQRCR